MLVPLSADVAPVARLVQRLYVVEEMSDQRADSLLDVPGYQSLHFLVRFRDEDREAVWTGVPTGRWSCRSARSSSTRGPPSSTT